MKLAVIAVAVACALSAAVALAQDDAANAAKRQQLLQSLHYQTGDIAVSKADAHLHLQPGFRYLDQADARKVLEQYWAIRPTRTCSACWCRTMPAWAPITAGRSC